MIREAITRERIAQADSYLNDVALPSYLEVVHALQRLVLDPRLEGYHSDAYDEAERVLGELRGVL
jgi:hypothetical protein